MTKDIGAYILYSDGRIFKKSTSKFMTGSTNSDGYIQVCQYGTLKKIHRIIAEAFVPNPENKPQVNHINGIKTDNRYENLEWCTQSENILHAFKIGLNIPNRGSKNGFSKLKELEVLEIRRRLLIPDSSMGTIAKEFNTSLQNICMIKLGKAWKHLL